MVTLQEVKQYLRIDFEDDDTLLLSLISTAKQLVMDVGRMDEERFSENEDVVRTAMLYTVSYLYENRNTADFSKLTLTLSCHAVCTARGCDVMEIGTLNQRITFLENRVVTDEIGNHTAVWDETFSCWARVTLKSSVENTEAGVTKETQKLEFLIRQSRNWMPSVTGNRILFQGNIYDITGITPDYLHKDYLKLTAEARKAGQNDQY
ncbi:MAG: head-tail connector protein [Ruminococcus callidus]